MLLFVFLGRAVTLDGAQAGIDEYLQSNWDVFTKTPEVWARGEPVAMQPGRLPCSRARPLLMRSSLFAAPSPAVAQIFFSVGITFGIMTAYGSHCKHGEPVFLNSW